MLKGRKLLVASLGVAAVSYACAKTPERPEMTGNLVAPMPEPDAGEPTAPTIPSAPEMTGNLMPPQPEPPPAPDAGQKPVKKGAK